MMKIVFYASAKFLDDEVCLTSNPKTEAHVQDLILRMNEFEKLEQRNWILERQLTIAMHAMVKAGEKSYPVSAFLDKALEEINRIENPAQNEAEKAFRL